MSKKLKRDLKARSGLSGLINLKLDFKIWGSIIKEIFPFKIKVMGGGKKER